MLVDTVADYKSSVSSLEATTYLFRIYRVLGINKPQRHKNLYIFYTIILNGLVNFLQPIAFTMNYFTNELVSQLGSLLTSIEIVINIYGCTVKFIIVAWLLPRSRATFQLLKKLDERCQAPDELELLKSIKKFGRLVIVLLAVSYLSYSVSQFICSLIAGHPPYGLYIPYINWKRSFWEFLVASSIEFLLMNVSCIVQASNDAYPIIYINILRTHIKILLKRLNRLGTDPDKSSEEHLEELKLCIKDHKNLNSLFETIAPIISTTVFVQFMITAAIIALTLINMLFFTTNISAVANSCVYIADLVLEIFPICYYANCLIDDNDLLSLEIFHSAWPEQNKIYRKMLIVFMQRSQQSMSLSAGKMFPINLNTFISVSNFLEIFHEINSFLIY
uniref:Odorant receptor n=1 Tax=Glossina austeni TaxID=7395 RepID=A0A240SW88_GLOAU